MMVLSTKEATLPLSEAALAAYIYGINKETASPSDSQIGCPYTAFLWREKVRLFLDTQLSLHLKIMGELQYLIS